MGTEFACETLKMLSDQTGVMAAPTVSTLDGAELYSLNGYFYVM